MVATGGTSVRSRVRDGQEGRRNKNWGRGQRTPCRVKCERVRRTNDLARLQTMYLTHEDSKGPSVYQYRIFLSLLGAALGRRGSMAGRMDPTAPQKSSQL